MRPFITCNLIAQTGNQLFIIAACIAEAIRNNADYLIPHYTSSRKLWPFYFRHLPEYTNQRIEFAWEQPSFRYHQIPYTPNMRILGYFQSYLYFNDVQEQVIKTLRPPHWKTETLPYLGIHVRRGDYLLHPTKHPVVTTEYINQVLETTDKQVLFFSDDIEWCKQNYKGHRFLFTENNFVLDDMQLLSRCEDIAISNSTFSYWAAMFNQNPDKKIYTPDESNWFGPDNKHLDVSDLLPPSWMRIKFDYLNTKAA